MLILVESYLKKRCATLPVMRRRYCMLVVDDSNPSSTKMKVMIRSYKNEYNRDTSIDSFVSSHVVKCIGEWTGKGNLHTYPNAFVIETLQSKLFHCSADTPEEKKAWIHAISIDDRLSLGSSLPPSDVPTPVHDRESIDLPGHTTNVDIPKYEGSTDDEPPSKSIDIQHQKDSLFGKEPKNRSNFDDIAIESDASDNEGIRVDEIYLDNSVFKNSGPRSNRMLDPLDETPFAYIDVPKQQLQYSTMAPAPPIYHEVVSDEEFLDLDPNMVARFSQMRMMEARGDARTSINPATRLAKQETSRPKKSKKKVTSNEPSLPRDTKKKTKKKSTKTQDEDGEHHEAEQKKKNRKKNRASESIQPPIPIEQHTVPTTDTNIYPAYQQPTQLIKKIQLPAIDDF